MWFKLRNNTFNSQWSNVFINNKYSFLIFGIVVIFELILLCLTQISISLFVGILAMSTSVFVSYLAIKTTYEVAYLGDQRKVLHKFINELMIILNHDKIDNPIPITELNHSSNDKYKSINDFSSLKYQIRMENTFDDIILRTKLNKYLITLINNSSDFLYLPKPLQIAITEYTSKYKIVHDVQTKLLKTLLKNTTNNEFYGLWRFIQNIACKTITDDPYTISSRCKHNFLIIQDYKTPIIDGKPVKHKDFKYKVYTIDANKELINELTNLAIKVYTESSETLSKMH